MFVLIEILFEPPLIVKQCVAVDQPQVDPPKRRGPNLNLSATKDFENLPEGSKIDLTMAGGTKGFVGKTATQFANEIGIVVRSVCPMNYHK
ncbi:hypothetical protein HanXRQr2_Chr04g0152201 [Helianthus annuus]|uniref:Uncharacterized protein n=1 Tax=Helianthus annuus TaxID=4232 RepID=A0A9K3NR99_HELAN|nr:hypothetical protein HanXRQr2_Chr04g0152201 [Helianthus annuus]KAJ0930197.1 hypothetical protein HanPSC8_Chr04g0146561 [Helianthus annuus]